LPYADGSANMAKTYYEPDEKGRMRITEKRGDKTPINIAVNKDPGNFYRRKAKMDADNDMSVDSFEPKDGKKILDRLLNKKNKKKGQV